MNMRFAEYMNKGLVIVLLLMFASTLGASLFFSYTMLGLNSLIQEGGQDVRAALTIRELQLDLRRMQSGERGFILSGSQNELVLYRESRDRSLRSLEALGHILTSEKYQRQIAQIRSIITDRVADYDKVIAIRQSDGLVMAAAADNSRHDDRLSSGLGELLEGINKDTTASIGPKLEQSRENLRHSIIIAVVLDAFILALCIFILRYFHQTIAKERAIEGAKNEFLSLASHQLRTPATSVKQYLGMVQAGYFGKLTRQQKEALDIAYQSNESEISIINSLLNVAKLNLQKITLVKKPVEVAPIVRQVVEEYRLRIESANQRVLFTNKLGKGRAMLDATYFKTVVENLVDNASKYSPPGATITVRLGRSRSKKLSPKRPQSVFRLAVSDTGVGIKKQDLGKLFKKFSRLSYDIEKSEVVEGSGLGLYWVKQIVERHGGRVQVRSHEGQGSTFTIEIPLV